MPKPLVSHRPTIGIQPCAVVQLARLFSDRAEDGAAQNGCDVYRGQVRMGLRKGTHNPLAFVSETLEKRDCETIEH